MGKMQINGKVGQFRVQTGRVVFLSGVVKGQQRSTSSCLTAAARELDSIVGPAPLPDICEGDPLYAALRSRGLSERDAASLAYTPLPADRVSLQDYRAGRREGKTIASLDEYRANRNL